MELTPKATDEYIDIGVGAGGVAAFVTIAACQSRLITKVAHGIVRRAAFAIGLDEIVRQVEP